MTPFRAGLLLAVVALFTLSARAQEPVSPDTTQEPVPLALLAALYFGAGQGSLHGGPLLLAGLEVETRYGLFVGRTTRNFETLPLLFPSKEPVEMNTELGVLYGRRLDISSVISVSAAAGVSSVSIIRRGKFVSDRQYERLETTRIGFPAELRMRFKDNRGWGGAFVSLVGNVNTMESYGGLMIGLYFGK